MAREKVEDKVRSRIKGFGKGRILFADDFADLGLADAVNKALQRLKEKGLLIRLSQGVYLYPMAHPLLGLLHPSVEEVAHAIAKRDRARVMPTGVQALHKLGLSTQVPLNVVYLTDGAARSLQIGRRTIKFKKATPKNLALKGEISGLAVQALREIGKGGMTLELKQKIQEQLRQEKPEHVRHDARLAPAWIREILLEVLK
jgi:hypothetical protein